MELKANKILPSHFICFEELRQKSMIKHCWMLARRKWIEHFSRIIVNSCKNMTKSRSGFLKISLSLPHSLYVWVCVCKNTNILIISTYTHKYTHNIYDKVYIGT